MPTILSIGIFRFHFYSDEENEPQNIHVWSSDGACKFWLEPVILAQNRVSKAHDLRELKRLVFEHKQLFIEKYHEYHDQ